MPTGGDSSGTVVVVHAAFRTRILHYLQFPLIFIPVGCLQEALPVNNFCATVDAKVTERMSAVLEFYYKRHGEITCLVTQECQIAWIMAHEISESPSSSALVTRLERPLVWK